MNIPRIMIAAPKSGSGKTMITCALLETLKSHGKTVSSFKCGPDYIDPMFHKKVIGVSSHNLDSFFLEEDKVLSVFSNCCEEENANIAVLEGVMGLFDGLGGVSSKASAYEIACITNTPIIMVVDVHGMGNSIVALLAGFLQYDTKHLIKGVILNHSNHSYYTMIKPLIERELSIPVLGYYAYHESLSVKSRHLGLFLPNEIDSIKDAIQKTSIYMQQTVDVEKIIEIAKNASVIEKRKIHKKKDETCEDFTGLKIAVAFDEAFCFYYSENLSFIESYGVNIVPFSPLHDKELPKGISGIILGGGYPENYARQLSENESMKCSLREHFARKIPSLAECGGFMYLHESLVNKEGESFPMTGIVKGEVRYQNRLVRFGYVDLFEQKPLFLPAGERIKGHEFHYYDSTQNGESCVAVKPISQRSWQCVHATDYAFWGFAHLYYLSNPLFIEHFLKKAKIFHESYSCTLG